MIGCIDAMQQAVVSKIGCRFGKYMSIALNKLIHLHAVLRLQLRRQRIYLLLHMGVT
jgi:hypothetical protein